MEGASSSFFSSFSSNSARNSDVRLSYSPEDTGRGFTSYLKHALRGQGITLSDEGSEVEDSKCSIVIFSPNYASSASRLDELVKILRCKETMGLIVIPIFYCVRPHDVGRQTGNFGEVFAQHGQDPGAQQWKEALAAVCEICGKDWDGRMTPAYRMPNDVNSRPSTWHPASFHNLSLLFFPSILIVGTTTMSA